MTINEVNTAVELPVMEQFYTIQGEGKNSGRAAYFIRLAGCDVGCVWCDVKESWNAGEHPLVKIDELVAQVKASGTDFVVITGGEPAMYDLTVLTARLKSLRVEIAMETSGCYPLRGHIDWYCFSPKKFREPCAEAYGKANEIKVIISHPSDFAWAQGHAERVNPSALRYLQTEWSKQERFLPMIIDYVKENPAWKISLQTHKYMNIP
ncbi:MAG: 7-carboxy-7-deazaguanine synthase QueE [Bacteroidota bacterium]